MNLLLDNHFLPDVYVDNTKDTCIDVSAEMLSALVSKVPYDMFSDLSLLHEGTYHVNLSELTEADWGNLRHLYILGNANSYTNLSLTKNSINPGAYLNKSGDFLLLIHLNERKIQLFLDRYGKVIKNLHICHTTLSALSLNMMSRLETVALHYNTMLNSIHGLSKLVSLISLNLSSCEKLTALPGLESLVNLVHLDLRGCTNLTSLPEFTHLSALKHVNITSCTSLSALPELDGLNELNSFNLAWCDNLSTLPELGNLQSLTSMHFSSCLSLSRLSAKGNLSNLTSLDIQNCIQLNNMPRWDMFPNLIQLNLSRNTNLTSLKLDNLAELKKLSLFGCTNLVSLSGLNSLPKLTSIDLSFCNGLTVLTDMEHLACLTSLNLYRCTNLNSLNLTGCKSLTKVQGLETLFQLIRLDLCGCENLTTLSIYIDKKGRYAEARLNPQSQLSELNLTGCNKITSLDCRNLLNLTKIQGLESLSSLTHMNLRGATKLTALPGVESLTQLASLDLSNCSSLTKLPGLEKLTKLTSLDLSNCQSLTELVGLESLTQLPGLYLPNCSSLTKLTGLENLTQLTSLDLSNCSSLTKLPGLEKLTKLTSLDLSNCSSLTELPELDTLFRLKTLDFSGTSITRIPNGIRSMKSLERLDLRGLHLKELPDWLPEIADQFSMNKDGHGWGKNKAVVFLHNTTVEGVDMSIFQQPYEMIAQWFKERKMGNTVPLNEIKVVFLGDGEAGKSHTIARLLNDGALPIDFDGQATPGIAINDQAYDLDGRQVKVHFWDFGGQEILHSMHRMFLTRRTLYVVLLNARDDTQDSRARYWLHNIKSFAPDAPVLLVLNKIDQNPNASINESGLRSLYPGLTEVVRMSALKYSQKKFNTTFTAALKRQIAAFKILESPFTPAWRRLKDKLLGMTKHYIRSPEYMDYCADCGVEESIETRKALLEWFKDLGVSFCYSESPKLEDYVVLQPQWITNAIYILLYNRIKGTKNGIVSHYDVFSMLKRPDTLADTIHRVLPDIFYTQDEVQYVLNVVRQFRLSYPVEGEKEFFPMLCNRNETEIVKEFARKSDVLEFRMVYEYLPNNVLHRLMVDMHRDLQTDNVWLTGAHFVQKYSNLSAVVKSDGNMLTIYVRRGTEYPAKVYLDSIRDHLERISQEMGLEINERQIAYYERNLFDTFDYDGLIGSRNNGIASVYSKRMKKAIPINNILQQSGHQVGEDREKLIQDLLNTCRRMQTNKLYWSTSEDNRNTYIRDALELMNYTAKDQTLVGTGAGGKRSGELDIEIRKIPNAPWTIFEGINLRGSSPSEVENWNDHLKKLLDNYNPIGLSFLIMTSYVPCHKNKFVSISNNFTIHMKTYSPSPYDIREATEVNTASDHTDETNFLRMVKCVYDCGGAITTVYHIFVRLGDESE